MSICPTCSSELIDDRIGGGRTVRLCPKCWTVWPPSEQHGRHLVAVPDERRDLA